MLKRFQIFKHKELLLSEEEGTQHYTAISEEALQTGLTVPQTNPMLDPESVGVIEAMNPEEAVEKFQETLEDSWM